MVVEVASGGGVLRDAGVVVRGELVVVVHRRRGRLCTVVEGGNLAVDLLAVEIPVAVAGSADDGLQRAVLSGRHELAAAVDGVAAEAHGVVLLAFSVPHRRRRGAERGLPPLAAAKFRHRPGVPERVVTRRRRYRRRLRHHHSSLHVSACKQLCFMT